ncbi:hypothetical protein AOLI_G00087250 [Acnodon oligacanthus]
MHECAPRLRFMPLYSDRKQLSLPHLGSQHTNRCRRRLEKNCVRLGHEDGYKQQTTFIKHASQVGTIPLYLTASLWKMAFGSKIALLESI